MGSRGNEADERYEGHQLQEETGRDERTPGAAAGRGPSPEQPRSQLCPRGSAGSGEPEGPEPPAPYHAAELQGAPRGAGEAGIHRHHGAAAAPGVAVPRSAGRGPQRPRSAPNGPEPPRCVPLRPAGRPEAVAVRVAVAMGDVAAERGLGAARGAGAARPQERPGGRGLSRQGGGGGDSHSDSGQLLGGRPGAARPARPPLQWRL